MPVTIETDLRLEAAIAEITSSPGNAKRLLEELQTSAKDVTPSVDELLLYVTSWFDAAQTEDRERFLTTVQKFHA